MSVKTFGNILTIAEAAKLISLSRVQINRLRKNGTFIEGIHFVQYSERNYRYFEDSLYHWATHQKTPDEHREWILSKTKDL